MILLRRCHSIVGQLLGAEAAQIRLCSTECLAIIAGMKPHSPSAKRESQWLVLRRCLAIVQRVQQGPATKQELLAAVYALEGEDAYGLVDDKTLSGKFEKDIARIRENLQVNVRYNRKLGGYVIEELERPLLNLPDAQLETLAFLLETFRDGTPHAPEVQRLVNTLLPWLAPDRRRVALRARGLLDVDLRQRDSDEIAPDVWTAVQEAYSARQQLEFDYLSGRYADGIPRHTIVEPWDLSFDTARGHYYLRAYCLWRDSPNGPSVPRAYRHYRVGRILAGSARVLPTKLPPTPRSARRYAVVYELAPEIARLGVSRQPGLAGEPQVEEGAESWTRITGQTEDLFLLSRNLLYYGPNCRVLGGPELLAEMRGLVKGLATIYQ
jgi:predicted DNA-binding transcriptional regulator YafY